MMAGNDPTAPRPHVPRFQSRRDFLFRAGGGFGALALAGLLQRDGLLAGESAKPAAGPFAPKAPHFKPRIERVLFLFMEGGPSHLDTFDPKPDLIRLNGQTLPASFGTVITPMGTGGNKLLASKRSFKQYGKSGTWVSDWLPHIAQCADDICVLRSCWADGLNHVGSVCQMNTGSVLAGRPSLGTWALYGLGTVNQDLPGFVVLTDGGNPVGGPRNWGTGFMPTTYQGTYFQSGPNPILHLKPPAGLDERRQRGKLDLIGRLNEEHARLRPEDDELQARINAYELAFKMQSAAPEAVDIANEPEHVKKLYGLDRPECAEFAHRCLLARRLLERGVRFVEVYCGAGSQWDAHSNLEGNHTKMCARCDQPTAALLKDLKQRDLLDSTLVIWGGEFGRTPMTEGKDGRDHNPYGFTMFFAGGGVKTGQAVGTTDEVGLRAVETRAHVHDIHATILHLLGFDHTKLTFLHNGREERLTENSGTVIQELLA
jgi:hypothetical protein